MPVHQYRVIQPHNTWRHETATHATRHGFHLRLPIYEMEIRREENGYGAVIGVEEHVSHGKYFGRGLVKAVGERAG